MTIINYNHCLYWLSETCDGDHNWSWCSSHRRYGSGSLLHSWGSSTRSHYNMVQRFLSPTEKHRWNNTAAGEFCFFKETIDYIIWMLHSRKFILNIFNDKNKFCKRLFKYKNCVIVRWMEPLQPKVDLYLRLIVTTIGAISSAKRPTRLKIIRKQLKPLSF